MAVAVKTGDYKTSLINNRRYLGNKYKLLPFITKVVNEECSDIDSVADIFAGTGAVSSAFTEKAGSSVTAIAALIKSARNRLFIVFSF